MAKAKKVYSLSQHYKAMKQFCLSFLLFISAAVCYAQDATSQKAMALKHAIYILELSDKRTDFDGPYQDITGELAQTTGGLEILKTKNFEKPEGIAQHYLFREPKKWPSFAANLSPEGAQAMKMAITEILPAEKPVGTYKSRTSNSEKDDTYFIIQGDKTIGSLSIKKDSGKGMLVMNAGF